MANSKKNNLTVKKSTIRIPEMRAKTDTFVFLRDGQNSELKRVISMADLQVGLIDPQYPPKGLILQPRIAPDIITNKLYNQGGSLHFSGHQLLSGTVEVSLDQVDLSANGGTVSGDSELTFTAANHILSLEAGNNVTLTGDSTNRKITVTSAAAATAAGSDAELQYNNGGVFGGVSSLTFNDIDGHLTIIDNKKLQFGNDGDGHIEYNADGDEYLVMSSSNIVFSGSTIFDGGSFFLGNASDIGTDVSIFVTGAAYSKNGALGGTTLFAGDVAVSGTLYVDRMVIELDEVYTGSLSISGSLFVSQSATIHEDLSVDGNMYLGEYLYHKNDTDTYVRFEDDEINIDVGGRQMIKLSEAGTDKIVLNNGALDIDLQVKGANAANLFRTDAANDSIYFGANSAAGDDNNFWVSGSIGSKDSITDRGTAVFGGDVHISGSITREGVSFVDSSGTPVNNQLAVWTNANTIEGDADLTWNGTTLYVTSAGTTLNVQGDSNLNGTVVINQSGVGEDFRVETANKSSALLVDGETDQVLLFSGSLSDAAGYGSAATDPDPRTFTDTNFFVSGSTDSRGTSVRGTSVFGGDVVISGTLAGGSPLRIDGGMSVTGTMELKPSSGGVAIVRNPNGPVKIFANSNLKLGSADGIIDLLDLEDGVAGALWLTGSGGASERAISMNTPGTLFFTGSAGGIKLKGGLENEGHILPSSDNLYNLGSETQRFANIYTGDLHLKNERGHWQIIEEEDCLIVINRLTNKKYKMVLEPYDEG